MKGGGKKDNLFPCTGLVVGFVEMLVHGPIDCVITKFSS